RASRAAARAASGHAAAPPISVMNARRFTRSPRRHGQAATAALRRECPGGPEVDDELELGWLYHWQVSRFLAFEDACNIDAGLTGGFGEVGAVAHQGASLG